MSERRLRELLRSEPTAAEREAEERSWGVVRAAYAERPAPATRRSRRSLALALAGAAALLGLVMSPAGAEVREWIEDVVEPGIENAAPALTGLPADGRILVQSGQGAWTVSDDGALRLLGDYREPTWSPGGVFVAAAHSNRLVAMVADPSHPLAGGQPAGTVRWSIGSARPIHDPRWAPSGFRVAYLAGEQLRVVGGDGSGDRSLATKVAPVAPAWRPAGEQQLDRRPTGVGTHELAFADRANRVHMVDTDTGKELWTAKPATTARIRELAWTGDGFTLAVLTEGGVSLLESEFGGRPNAHFGFRATGHEETMAASSRGQVAVVRHGEADGAAHSDVLVIDTDSRLSSKRVAFSGPGRFTDLAWSPDGTWLLVAWRSADQWLFIRPADGTVKAVSNIGGQFSPGVEMARFPRVNGWCCT